MAPRSGRRCLPSSIAPSSTRTTVPKSPISRLANVSGKCESSNLLVKRNDSCRCTDSSKTSSASDATCCKLVITESYEVALFSSGTRLRARCNSKGRRHSTGTGSLARRQLDSAPLDQRRDGLRDALLVEIKSVRDDKRELQKIHSARHVTNEGQSVSVASASDDGRRPVTRDGTRLRSPRRPKWGCSCCR